MAQKKHTPRKPGPFMRSSMAKADPMANYLGHLNKSGINPFGTTDYNEWLQGDAFGMVDSLYGMALQRRPQLTRSKFHSKFFNNPRAESVLGEENFAQYNAQQNPRDYYNSQLQAAGVDLGGVSPFERFMREEGYNQAADAYGAAAQRQPKLGFYQFLKPNAFRTS